MGRDGGTGGRPGGSLDIYLREIGSRSPLSREEEAALAVRIEAGERAALEKLVSANLRFVVTVARRYRGRGLPLEDLVNEGNLGLLEAARRFDGSRGVRFITYAVWWIRQAILRALARASPRQLPNGRAAGRSARPRRARHVSLEAPLERGGGRLLDLLPDERVARPDGPVQRSSLRDALDASLAALPEREERVLRLYYGMDGDAPVSLARIAERLGVSRERVRQIRSRALARVRAGGGLAGLGEFAG